MKIKSTIIAIVFGASFMLLGAGCKKDPKPKVNRDALTKDSIFLYAKEVYYWNEALPEYASFNPRGFSSFEQELYAITQYPVNPVTGKSYEYIESYPGESKYSFIDDGSVSSELGGVGGDYGFSVNYNTQSDLRVKYVYAGSPAAAAGLERSDRIIELNGRTSLDATNDADLDFVNNAIFGGEKAVSMKIRKADGSTKDVTVNSGTYDLDPILYTHIYTEGNKKVGYIVFNQFTYNDQVYADLKETINSFSTAGVSELIVDLRYNGGGSVQTAADFANLIVPAAQNGKVMFTTYYNQTLQNLKTQQQRKSSILVNQPLTDQNNKLQYSSDAANGKYYTYADIGFAPTKADYNVEVFKKDGSLNVSTVYFIVTGSTASASELLINSLKPAVNVKLIGKKTYGKPVGFFAIHIDKYDMYIPEFETKNQQEVGGYYTGMAVDKEGYEDLSKKFGDPSEVYLSYALNHAANGTFSVSNPSISAISSTKFKSSSAGQKITAEFGNIEFKGMISVPKNPHK
ncbi:S41 family peptidase [Rubrolithibacter danxiaensis]|uniref:S41 family peptidase n=1 Tax=Rubrolithibacter danxiaensis TaxID=3390805 RepID=UPI003BF84AD1